MTQTITRFPLTYEEALEVFVYHPDGHLIWRCNRNGGCQKGARAGARTKRYGCWTLEFKGQTHHVHRLIFLLHHGYNPEGILFLDGNRENCRIENLVAANHSSLEPKRRVVVNNNRSPHPLVSYDEHRLKWQVSAKAQGRRFIRFFIDLDQAISCANTLSQA